MPTMSDEQQTAVRRSLWKGQHGQDMRMAEPVPDADDEDDMDDEEDLEEEEDEEEES